MCLVGIILLAMLQVRSESTQPHFDCSEFKGSYYVCLSDYVASLEVFCDGCWCQSVQGQIYLNGN